MTDPELALLTQFINLHRQVLASDHDAIPCAAVNLQQVRDKLEEVCKCSNEHDKIAFGIAEGDPRLDDDDYYCPDVNFTPEQEIHYQASINLRQYIKALRQLVAEYEPLAHRLN